MAEKIHVGLIYGGRSPEHEVSIDSAHNVLNALDADRYRVTPIRIDRAGRWHVEDAANAALHDPASAKTLEETPNDRALLSPAEEGAEVSTRRPSSPSSSSSGSDDAAPLDPLGLDVAFPILHGPNGEDGRVQGLLHLLGLPYVGADVLASSSCMDKEVTKRLMRDAGLPVVPFRVVRFGQALSFADAADALGTTTLFIKPANAGSSVGAAKVEDEAAYDEGIEAAFGFDNKVLVEQTVEGREIECAVIGNEEPRATVPGEVVSTADFYTYEAKYDEEADAAHMEVPADLPEDVAEQIRTLATRAYRVLGCEGMARVDFFVTEQHDLFLNEINTIPGFTRRSMFPVMWEHMGLDQGDLLDTLIQLALDRHERDSRLKVTL